MFKSNLENVPEPTTLGKLPGQKLQTEMSFIGVEYCSSPLRPGAGNCTVTRTIFNNKIPSSFAAGQPVNYSTAADASLKLEELVLVLVLLGGFWLIC